MWCAEINKKKTTNNNIKPTILFANATLFNWIRLKYTFNKFASKMKNYKDVAGEYF